MSFYIRKMEAGDIGQVTEIDREVFSSQWPPPNYKRELQNGLSHHVVVIDDSVTSDAHGEAESFKRETFGLLVRILRWLKLSRKPAKTIREHIVGFAGLWVIADEAHVTSIAVKEKYRGRKIGAILMVALFDIAVQLKANALTLEVRVSNTVAQSLYTKFGFKEVGLRRGYYTDNREDALLMTTDAVGDALFQNRLAGLKRDYFLNNRQMLRENIFTGNL